AEPPAPSAAPEPPAPRPAPRPAAPAANGSGATPEDIVRHIALAEGATYRPAAALFRDFAIRCRQAGIASAHIDIARFRRIFAHAVSGLDRLESKAQAVIAQAAEGVDDDCLAPYLAILIAAHSGHAMPGEDELGRLYGSASPSRVRRLLDHLERQGRIVVREDFGGERSITVPLLPAAA
ncbi:MAG: ATP-binding protein, partial [Erythrobacter sp.]|nr:ATP-binding protein [Erythrobacter sp.]